MVNITKKIIIPDEELKEEFFLSSGAGGQHVNKVATAVRLRYNLLNSEALPPDLKQRIMEKHKARLTSDGELLIEARRTRNEGRVRSLLKMRAERKQRLERSGDVTMHLQQAHSKKASSTMSGATQSEQTSKKAIAAHTIIS